MAKKPQVAGRCVFCNGLNLTKEHIWSDFLTKRGLVPAAMSHTNMRTKITRSSGKVAFIAPEVPDERQGALIQRQIRRVCKKCNPGWMRDIVNEAVPIVESIILGLNPSLGAAEQRALTLWITLACIMAEYTDEKSAGVSQIERTLLQMTKAPLPNWIIYVGRYRGKRWQPTGYRHHGFNGIELPGPGSFNGPQVFYGQTSTYVLGTFAVFAFSATSPAMFEHMQETIKVTHLRRIWPFESQFDWNTAPEIGEFALNLIANAALSVTLSA
jgi:hypothetical protein